VRIKHGQLHILFRKDPNNWHCGGQGSKALLSSVKITNACPTTKESWRLMHPINYGNSQRIKMSNREDEEVEKEVGGYCSSRHASVITRQKERGKKV